MCSRTGTRAPSSCGRRAPLLWEPWPPLARRVESDRLTLLQRHPPRRGWLWRLRPYGANSTDLHDRLGERAIASCKRSWVASALCAPAESSQEDRSARSWGPATCHPERAQRATLAPGLAAALQAQVRICLFGGRGRHLARDQQGPPSAPGGRTRGGGGG